MASVMHLLVDNYNEVAKRTKDPLVDSWLFMESPVYVLSILVFYLYFVLKLGPKFMESRKPYDLKKVLIAYNAYQVVFSSLFCLRIIQEGGLSYIFSRSCIKNYPLDLKTKFSEGAWWYFFSKIVELLDTVFFVLRKKQNQVTFLHVYHHMSTALFSWGYLKFLPGEQGVFIGFLNSFVHVVMYSYYLIAALGPQYQKYLWWKKYMTWIQLTQFVMMLIYLCHVLTMDCGLPKALTFFFVVNVTIFMYLFADFYRKAYLKKKSDKNQNQTQNSTKTKEIKSQ